MTSREMRACRCTAARRESGECDSWRKDWTRWWRSATTSESEGEDSTVVAAVVEEGNEGMLSVSFVVVAGELG
jgi:hypothetical protein